MSQLRSEVPEGGEHPPPLVSIVIPCYGQAHYLAEAIESAMAQTHPRVEVVVVDDGSPDNVEEVTSRFPGVRNIRLRNMGLPSARNAGAQLSTGDYLIFLDSDDRLYPEAAAVALEQFDTDRDAALVVGDIVLVDETGAFIRRPERLQIGPNPYESLLHWNPIGNTLTAMIKRSAFEALGGFNPDRRVSEDYDLWLRLARKYRIVQHDNVVGEYRQHQQSMSYDGVFMMQAVLNALRLQWPHVKHDARLRSFYALGVRYWKQIYTEQAIRQLEAHIAARDWVRAGAVLVPIMRHRPMRVLGGIIRTVLRQLRGWKNAQTSRDVVVACVLYGLLKMAGA